MATAITLGVSDDTPYTQHIPEITKEDENSELILDDIELLLLKICDRERAIQWGRKIAHFESKIFSQNLHEALNCEKADYMRQKKSLCVEAAAVICQIGAGILGGQTVAKGAALIGTSQIFSAMAGQVDRHFKGNEERTSHHYQHLSQLLSENSQARQTAERALEQVIALIERLNQNGMRNAQALLG